MKGFLLAVLLMGSIHAFGQQDLDIMENGIYRGVFQFEDLVREEYQWFEDGAKAYKPNGADIDYLNKYLDEYELVIFMGTWCPDSHREIPRLYQVLDGADFPMVQYTMYGLDRNKQSKNGEEKKYNIKMVPTVIVLKDEEEIARIIEAPKKSWEADLANIIKKDRE